VYTTVLYHHPTAQAAAAHQPSSHPLARSRGSAAEQNPHRSNAVHRVDGRTGTSVVSAYVGLGDDVTSSSPDRLISDVVRHPAQLRYLHGPWLQGLSEHALLAARRHGTGSGPSPAGLWFWPEQSRRETVGRVDEWMRGTRRDSTFPPYRWRWRPIRRK
jgi:hypothetical protein